LLLAILASRVGKGRGNEKGFLLNGKHEILVYFDDVNPFDRNINSAKRTTQNLVDVSKEFKDKGTHRKRNAMYISQFQPSSIVLYYI
jgi:hypothetical protein